MAVPSKVVSHDRHHSVGFYGGPKEFADSVGAYVGGGLRRGEVVLVLATAEHRAGLDATLTAIGFDLAELRATGRYVSSDAHGTLDGFMVGGHADAGRFAATVGETVTELAAGKRPLRIFGEMVGVLWARGHVAAAIEVEELWNKLRVDADFTLHCGYELDGYGPEGDLDLLRQLCMAHTRLTTPSWSPTEDDLGPDEATLDRYTRVFLPTLTAPRAVRRYVDRVAAQWGRHVALDELALVASELATNAVQHANSPFEVCLLHVDGRLTLRVRDASPAQPVRRDPDVTAPNGRGLGIIAELASAWGVDPHDGGKVVWVELDADRTTSA